MSNVYSLDRHTILGLKVNTFMITMIPLRTLFRGYEVGYESIKNCK